MEWNDLLWVIWAAGIWARSPVHLGQLDLVLRGLSTFCLVNAARILRACNGSHTGTVVQ